MRVRVRLFAALREAIGSESFDLDLEPEATPETVWAHLTSLHQGASLASRRASLAAAINRKYARFDTPLSDGDEVVFIPPVSGG